MHERTYTVQLILHLLTNKWKKKKKSSSVCLFCWDVDMGVSIYGAIHYSTFQSIVSMIPFIHKSRESHTGPAYQNTCDSGRCNENETSAISTKWPSRVVNDLKTMCCLLKHWATFTTHTWMHPCSLLVNSWKTRNPLSGSLFLPLF